MAFRGLNELVNWQVNRHRLNWGSRIGRIPPVSLRLGLAKDLFGLTAAPKIAEQYKFEGKFNIL